MSTLIEVEMSTISAAAEAFKLKRQRGKLVITQLKEKKIKVRSFWLFKKEVSVWDYLYESSIFSPSVVHKAYKKGYITEEEMDDAELSYVSCDFSKFCKHGTRAFLNPGDYRFMYRLLNE